MKSQRFGIEIEMTGLTRSSAALIIAKHFDTGFRHERGVYDTYSVCDQDGRKWKIVEGTNSGSIPIRLDCTGLPAPQVRPFQVRYTGM